MRNPTKAVFAPNRKTESFTRNNALAESRNYRIRKEKTFELLRVLEKLKTSFFIKYGLLCRVLMSVSE